MTGEDTTVPTACTLDAAAARARIARWAALRDRAQTAFALPRPDLLEVSYRPGDDIAAELRNLAAMEAECCAFLSFTVIASAHALTLQVSPSPDAGVDVAADLASLTKVITSG